MSYKYLSKGFESKETDNVMAEMLGQNPPKKTVTGQSQQFQPSSKTVSISNESDFFSVLKQYEDEKNTTIEWILLEPSTEGQIKYVTTGNGIFSGGPPDSLAKLIDDNKVQYLIVTMQSTVRQLALMTWIGASANKDTVKLSDTQKLNLHAFIGEKLHHGTTFLSGELRG